MTKEFAPGLALDTGEFIPARNLNAQTAAQQVQTSTTKGSRTEDSEMTDKKQPEALRLADWVESVVGGPHAKQCAAELRRLHAENETLREKLKFYEVLGDAADDMQLLRTGYAAARLEIESLKSERDRFRAAYHEWSDKTEWVRKSTTANELGKHLADVLRERIEGLQAKPVTATQWVPVDERLPEPDWPVLAHNGKWTGVAAWMSGDYLEPLERWQDEHREFIEMMGPAITHWMPLSPPPSSAKGVAHG